MTLRGKAAPVGPKRIRLDGTRAMGVVHDAAASTQWQPRGAAEEPVRKQSRVAGFDSAGDRCWTELVERFRNTNYLKDLHCL